VNPNKGSRPIYFGKTVYISAVNGAKKVMSDVQIAINKNSDPVQFPEAVAGEDSAPTQISQNFWNCLKRVELGGSY